MDNLQDGNMSVVEPEDIADEMMYQGDANELMTALLYAGFIDERGGSYFIHDWHDYIGRLLDKRKVDAERKRTKRGKNKDDPPDNRVLSAGRPTDIHGTGNGSPVDGAGNSTVQYSTLKDTTTTKDDFNRVSKIYGAIHGKHDIETIHWPLLSKLLDEGITADTIITTMQDKHAEKVKTGGKVSSFSYYEEAIRERHKSLDSIIKFPERGGKRNDGSRPVNSRGVGQFDHLSL